MFLSFVALERSSRGGFPAVPKIVMAIRYIYRPLVLKETHVYCSIEFGDIPGCQNTSTPGSVSTRNPQLDRHSDLGKVEATREA